MKHFLIISFCEIISLLIFRCLMDLTHISLALKTVSQLRKIEKHKPNMFYLCFPSAKFANTTPNIVSSIT